jgi:hypothetical protein
VAVGAASVFPVLFAAGMSLLDTTEGVMMVGACRWAFVEPLRKLYYNLTITLMSIAVALFIGGVEIIALAVPQLAWKGRRRISRWRSTKISTASASPPSACLPPPGRCPSCSSARPVPGVAGDVISRSSVRGARTARTRGNTG